MSENMHERLLDHSTAMRTNRLSHRGLPNTYFQNGNILLCGNSILVESSCKAPQEVDNESSLMVHAENITEGSFIVPT